MLLQITVKSKVF